MAAIGRLLKPSAKSANCIDVICRASLPGHQRCRQGRGHCWRAQRPMGQSTPELLARYDRATSSWRTSQLCLDGALSEFSETWPRSGTMRNGTAYQLPPLVPLTDATASGSWPTPSASRLTEVAEPIPGRLLTQAVGRGDASGQEHRTFATSYRADARIRRSSIVADAACPRLEGWHRIRRTTAAIRRVWESGCREIPDIRQQTVATTCNLMGDVIVAR